VILLECIEAIPFVLFTKFISIRWRNGGVQWEKVIAKQDVENVDQCKDSLKDKRKKCRLQQVGVKSV